MRVVEANWPLPIAEQAFACGRCGPGLEIKLALLLGGPAPRRPRGQAGSAQAWSDPCTCPCPA